MKSLSAMLNQIHGLLGTNDLNDFENDFVQSVWDKSENGKNTTVLSSKQVEVVERIFKKNFGG